MTNLTNKLKVYPIILVLLIHLFMPRIIHASQLQWPRITRQSKPWTRWWWMGNCVNKKDLYTVMQEYKKAGLGGLELTPIYGVKGYEEDFIPYLSPEWMEMLVYTLEKAEELDLGVDMATGTGWPFGGPWVGREDACKNMVYKTYTLKKGETLQDAVEYIQKPTAFAVGHRISISDLVEPISENKDLQSLALEQVRFKKQLPLQTLMAYSDQGDILDLTNRLNKHNHLDWVAPDGQWTLYAVFQGWHGKMVERAAPGGEGNVIDHFSKKALETYLDKFNASFKGHPIQSLRAFFNDSYEVDDARGEANFTTNLFDEFKIRKGYDLRHFLPALFSSDPTEETSRLLCDYREVISDLLLEEFTMPWREWARSKNAVTRNQAHGSPANILDLYAASDIPETEGTDIIRFKFASSAGHVSGKPLVSSESATWLDEHFLSSLEDVKHALDRYFLGGVNHIVYHGTPYSPPDEAWPGWLFYAAVHFGPSHSFWKDFPKLNRYVTRCQSFLQAGSPANDILLYYPIYDEWSKPDRGLLKHFRGRAEGTSVRRLGEALIEGGYSFDFISDRQIRDIQFTNSGLQTAGAHYQTIIIPECKFMPLETFKKLVHLAGAGAEIIFHNGLPLDVSGLSHLEKKQTAYQQLIKKLAFKKLGEENISRAVIDQGEFLMGDDIHKLLDASTVEREPMVDRGLQFVKRKSDDGPFYFIVNQAEKAFDGWIPIQTQAGSAAIFNPMSGNHGLATCRVSEDGSKEVYLQLEKGESCILQIFNGKIEGPDYPYTAIKGRITELTGEWDIQFLTGGPVLPEDVKIRQLTSWTELDEENVQSFSGTAQYIIRFEKPKIEAESWMLDLGSVYESAVVSLNGIVLDTLITAPYRIHFSDEVLQDKNDLKIRVSNLMANRIAFMERNNRLWKKFYNINFPPRNSENRGSDGTFSAIDWKPQKSGLIGPVKIIPFSPCF